MGRHNGSAQRRSPVPDPVRAVTASGPCAVDRRDGRRTPTRLHVPHRRRPQPRSATHHTFHSYKPKHTEWAGGAEPSNGRHGRHACPRPRRAPRRRRYNPEYGRTSATSRALSRAGRISSGTTGAAMGVSKPSGRAHLNASPTPAKRLTHGGAPTPVSRRHSWSAKWLQFLARPSRHPRGSTRREVARRTMQQKQRA